MSQGYVFPVLVGLNQKESYVFLTSKALMGVWMLGDEPKEEDNVIIIPIFFDFFITDHS